MIDHTGGALLADTAILDILDSGPEGLFAPYGQAEDVRIIAPEVLARGRRTVESDVYAFASLALRECPPGIRSTRFIIDYSQAS